MATIADPTVEFMAQFDDESKWLIKRRVPIFKPHERLKKDAKTGQPFVAYTVTQDDLESIAERMQTNQKNGVPARMTVGHVIPLDSKGEPRDEKYQPKVIGHWLNPQVGTFGPNSEPCILADAYLKVECKDEAKGRPYRSAEYYHGPRELRGCGLFTSDPALDMGTVEIYVALPRGGTLCPIEGEVYMADDAKSLPDVGMEKVGEPQGHKEWCCNMEHYSKGNQWVSHAMQNYQNASAPSATNTSIPQAATPAKGPDMEVQRMNRDDEATNYARLSAEVAELTKAREADRATIAQLTAERDREQCERMVKQLQLEGYQLKTAETVERLVKKSPEDREEYIATVKQFAVPNPTGGLAVEVYAGKLDEPGKAKPSALTAEQAGRAAGYAKGDTARFEKARSALLAGQPLED